MKQFIASAIVLFSESIWIYFVFGLFMSAEWNEPIFVHAVWWLVAGIAGYLINCLFGGKVHYIMTLSLNVFFVIVLIIQNWKASVPEGSWLAGIFFSIAVMYVYVRSASFVYKAATRMQMLQRFECNVFIYVALLFIFTFNNWVNDYFHLAFLGAIFSTLLGMILTLDIHEEIEVENKQIDVQRVGNPSGFIAVITVLFSSVVVISSILFLPAVRDKLQQFAFFGMSGVSWFVHHIWKFFAWLFSLFGTPDVKGTLPEAGPDTPIDMGDMQEEIGLLPIGWIFVGIGMVVVFLLLFLFGYFLKNWRPPEIGMRKRVIHSTNRPNWNGIWEKIIHIFAAGKKMFRKRFARFYKQEVYWNFQQVQTWGKKHGISRGPTETNDEFIDRVIQQMEIVPGSEQEKEQLAQGLRELSADYQAAYYGNKNIDGNYNFLVKQLKNIHVKKVL